jgi:PAS domain S-box-containing protein
MRRELARQARSIAAAVSPDDIRSLSFTPEDTARPQFQRLSSQMRAYAEAAGIRSLYTMALRDGKLVFGPESLDPDDPYASPPGTIYQTPTPKDFEVFRTGEAMIQGPAVDEYGEFVTASIPVTDPRTGTVLATVGLDIEARVWRGEIRKAQWIPFLTAMIPLGILMAEALILGARRRLLPGRHEYLRHTEAVTCAIILLLLTLITALLIHDADKKSRETVFRTQAQIKSEVYTDVFQDLGHSLDVLTHFFESSENVSREEFSSFCDPFIRQNSIQACVWLPEVPSGEAARFTAQVDEKDLPGFSIWQLDESGGRIPAQGDHLYPALYIAPQSGHEKALGYNLYSEPLRKAAIDEALRTSLAAATAPINLILPGTPEGFIIFKPVSSKQQKGMVGFAVRPATLFANQAYSTAGETAGLHVALFHLRAGNPPRWLACPREGCAGNCWRELSKGLHAAIPVFAFGQTYTLLIAPEAKWLAAHPLRGGQTALMVGLVLTLLLTALIDILATRPYKLEKLVQQRTAELLRLSTAIEQSPEAVVITDPDGTIQYVNPAFERITGYSSPEAIGRNSGILKSGQHDASFYSDLWKTISSGKIWEGRFVNKRKDGIFYTEDASISPVRDPSGTITGYVAVKRDITSELAKEEQFRQSQKMEAVGHLAGGIAHDFNNILQAILGFSEILQARLTKDSEECRNAFEIQKAARRAAEITQHLLAFSRKQPVDRKRINLNAAIRDAEVLLQLLLGNKSKCILELSPSPQEVYADHSQITQIIMNLAVNARDAMPDGGRLTIATENITFDPLSAAALPGAEPGTFVCLSVTDTGCGISREAKEHLFEPFFTTKEVGRGTGLGLAVVYGIVKQNKGWLHVYSEEGEGTTFKVYLPVCEAAIQEKPADRTNNGRILLVEDAAETRNLVIRILNTSGYETVATASAEEALELFRRQKGDFDLLFSDMTLPAKSGLELADELRAENPNLPVLLYSGYQDQRERWTKLESKGYRFLQKPFAVTGLLAAVHDALAETVR